MYEMREVLTSKPLGPCMIGGITETIRNVPIIHEAKNDATLPNVCHLLTKYTSPF